MKRKPHNMSYLTTLAKGEKYELLHVMHVKGMLTILKISVATLRAKNEEAPHGNVAGYRGRTQKPDQGVSEKIDLAMIFHPEIL
jgi:hypothetical protein